ncbi:unnamed protein product [Urochloa humidicola]
MGPTPPSRRARVRDAPLVALALLVPAGVERRRGHRSWGRPWGGGRSRAQPREERASSAAASCAGERAGGDGTPPHPSPPCGAPPPGSTAVTRIGSPTAAHEAGLHRRRPRDARASPPSRPPGALGLPRPLVEASTAASGKRGVEQRREEGLNSARRRSIRVARCRCHRPEHHPASRSMQVRRSPPATEQRSRPNRLWIRLLRPRRPAAAPATCPSAGPAPVAPRSARRGPTLPPCSTP